MSKVKGFAQFQKNMKALQSEMPEVLESGMQVGGMVIERDARERCPYFTGNLRRSIHTVVKRERKDVRAYIGTNVEYGLWLEYGTSKMPGGRPFLRPALDSKAREALSQVVRVLNRYFEKQRSV